MDTPHTFACFLVLCRHTLLTIASHPCIFLYSLFSPFLSLFFSFFRLNSVPSPRLIPYLCASPSVQSQRPMGIPHGEFSPSLKYSLFLFILCWSLLIYFPPPQDLIALSRVLCLCAPPLQVLTGSWVLIDVNMLKRLWTWTVPQVFAANGHEYCWCVFFCINALVLNLYCIYKFIRINGVQGSNGFICGNLCINDSAWVMHFVKEMPQSMFIHRVAKSLSCKQL